MDEFIELTIYGTNNKILIKYKVVVIEEIKSINYIDYLHCITDLFILIHQIVTLLLE